MEEKSSNSYSSFSEGTKTFTDLGFDESMSEPPTPLPTRRPRIDSELSCSVSTMSEISTSSSQLQTQNSKYVYFISNVLCLQVNKMII